MRKSFKVLGYILGIIWLLVLAFFHFGIFSAFEYKNGSLPFWIICIGIWWVLFTAVMIIGGKIENKNQYKKEREYREKSISDVIITDDFFGAMVFEYDSELKTLDSKNVHLPLFGADSPETLEIYEYSEDLRDTIFGNLRELYNHADEILERVYPEFLETCREYEEIDERGKPYTLESLRKSVCADMIIIMNGGTYFELSFTTGYTDFGGHGFVACVNFADKTLDFKLEG